MTLGGKWQWARFWRSGPGGQEQGTMLDRETLERMIDSLTDDVLRRSAPRNDVKVTLDGFEITPFMGLTSWVASRGAISRRWRWAISSCWSMKLVRPCHRPSSQGSIPPPFTT